MKLKIIVVPLLVLAVIIFAIWFFVPAFSAVRAARKSLAEVNGRIADVQRKTDAAKNLSQELGNNSENQDILLAFMPSEKREEDIINYLSDVIYTQGLLAYNISFANVETSISITDAQGNPIDPATGRIITDMTPSPEVVKVSYGAIGNYDQIKGMIRKLANLKRLNRVSDIKIFKEASDSQGNQKEEAASGNLKMEGSVEFSYLDKVKEVTDINSGIFTSGKFDMSAIEKIKSTKDTEVPEISVGSQGKGNPFTP